MGASTKKATRCSVRWPCRPSGWLASAPQPKVLLTVSGRIGRINNDATDTFDFDAEAEFLEAGYDQHHDRHTVDADLGVCRAPAARCHASGWRHIGQAGPETLDDYSAPIPWDDLVRYGVILAHSQGRSALEQQALGPVVDNLPSRPESGRAEGPHSGIEVHLASRQDRSGRLSEGAERRGAAQPSVEPERLDRRSGDRPSAKGMGWWPCWCWWCCPSRPRRRC